MAPPTRKYTICTVCNADGARFNYQAHTCENCRVFFFRMVNIKRDINAGECYSNCEISYKNRRNCKPCRYRKCLEVGMQISEVGKRITQAAHTAPQFKKSEIAQYIRNFHENIVNYGTKAAYRLKMAKDASEFVGLLVDFENLSIVGQGKSILECKANLEISISELIHNPGACSSRDTSVFYPVWSDPTVREIDYKKCYCRSITAFSEFMTTLEEFHQLDMGDKISLFQANYLIYTLCEVVFRQYICKKKNFISYKYVPYTTKNAPPDYWYSRSLIYRQYTMSPVQTLLDLDLTIEEYLLLRTIAMLFNCTMLSSNGQMVIIRAREKYTLMLAEWIKLRYPPEKAIQRVETILGLVRLFEQFSFIGKEKHAHMVINNYIEMDGQLSRELHIMGSSNERVKKF